MLQLPPFLAACSVPCSHELMAARLQSDAILRFNYRLGVTKLGLTCGTLVKHGDSFEKSEQPREAV